MTRSFTSSTIALGAVLVACTGEVPVVEVTGECADVHEAQLCTWAEMQGETVLAVGATVPMASIANAPAQADMVWPPVMAAVLEMPEASRDEAGLTEVTIFWEPMGHPPGAYLMPHFDFHWYTIPREERLAIDCADLVKPDVLPAGYALPDVELPAALAEMAGADTLIGLCVEEMGMHSLLISELEGEEVFRGSIVVGFYQGRPIFVEPMVTRALLMERESFDLVIPEIPGMTSAYPTTFRAEYDPEAEAYRFAFTDFASGA